ncbi:metastasis-suppressor KiSS-1 isoform X1 [Bos javanicus]|uniref:metastasis-suppressor KiSS-1 isoform X1 n=1 Tax=Bos javanicus TaxID=9906 RepID=UPI002AA74578|nr:metastasis-suppressor KiSS-1 isoform X1 [Bos javanicus]
MLCWFRLVPPWAGLSPPFQVPAARGALPQGLAQAASLTPFLLPLSVLDSGHFQDLHLLTRMNVLLSWQLMLLLCATAFRETLEKVAPMENPRTTGSQLGPATLRAPWEQSPQCTAGKPEVAGPRPRGAALCPPESSAGPQRLGPCAPRSRLIPSPRGAVLVQREKDVSAYNWNSFGLRYGRRQAALPGSRSAARG